MHQITKLTKTSGKLRGFEGGDIKGISQTDERDILTN
jgi:hypothetical protein